ncbi:hypothetical protein B296_00012505 [Ensete ventricosum]|uniref:Uncharacterized protein n=1 Tax=Ensete ventricosum TaxID=4639 RepID=A0A427A521_ENSVE|nr:hypothetical protein B296_00012505 [Ensete ventricosum]
MKDCFLEIRDFDLFRAEVSFGFRLNRSSSFFRGLHKNSETLLKFPAMAAFGETEVEFGGELGEEPCRIDSPIETGGADRVPEVRGSVSPSEAVNFSPGGGKTNGDLVGGEFFVESPLNPSGSPSSVAASAKGYGLKKWRRIWRDTSEDVTGNADHSSESWAAASAPRLQHEVLVF